MELPEGCIAAILSHTTPKDACRASLVSKTFRSAADSDLVWDRFIPFDSHSITVPQSHPSKKALYLSLYDHPVIIDDGKKSLQLDKMSGNKCYILGAKALSVRSFTPRGEHPKVWTRQERTLPESRFPVVAEVGPWEHMLRIHGLINTLSLSPSTQYGAFLVFKIIDVGTVPIPMMSTAFILGGHEIAKAENIRWKSHLLKDEEEARANDGGYFRRPRLRTDSGWLETQIGETFNSGLENKVLHMLVLETKACLIIEGIELRPMEDKTIKQT